MANDLACGRFGMDIAHLVDSWEHRGCINRRRNSAVRNRNRADGEIRGYPARCASRAHRTGETRRGILANHRALWLRPGARHSRRLETGERLRVRPILKTQSFSAAGTPWSAPTTK